VGFPVKIMEAFAPHLTAESRGVLVVTYDYLFCSPATSQNSRYDWFPIVANDWRTIHPILDKALPLQAEEEGPPT
jgi:hypothetical protein